MATKKTASTKKTTAKKKTASKGASRSRAAARPATPAAAPPGRSGVPLAVLAIMALLAVIAFMINNLYLGKGRDSTATSSGKETRVIAPPADDPEEKESPKREAPESKQVSREEGPSSATVVEVAKVYFVRHDERDDGLRLVPVTRKVTREKRLEQSLRELARGPTTAEKGRGLLNAVPPDLRVRSVKVRNRVAEVDFNGAIEEGATGSILINRVDQIIYTLTEFPDVDAVLIKVNGRRRTTLGADGLSIGAPRTRSR